MKKTVKKIYKKNCIHICSFLGAFIGIAIVGLLNQMVLKQERLDNTFLIASLGATAVLIFGEIKSPLSKPKNVIWGHVIGAFVGVSFYKLFGNSEFLWLSSAFSVAVSILVMRITKTTHPPGGATALIANIGREKIKGLGYMFILSPVLTGVVTILLISLAVNKFFSRSIE